MAAKPKVIKSVTPRDLKLLAARARTLHGDEFEEFVRLSTRTFEAARRLVTRVNLEDALKGLGPGRHRALKRTLGISRLSAQVFERRKHRTLAREWVGGQSGKGILRLRMALRQHRAARGDT